MELPHLLAQLSTRPHPKGKTDKTKQNLSSWISTHLWAQLSQRKPQSASIFRAAPEDEGVPATITPWLTLVIGHLKNMNLTYLFMWAKVWAAGPKPLNYLLMLWA